MDTNFILTFESFRFTAVMLLTKLLSILSCVNAVLIYDVILNKCSALVCNFKVSLGSNSDNNLDFLLV